MKKNFFFYAIAVFLVYGCSKDDDGKITEKRAYIVGFDPCTINHSYRIGYILITEDLNDTLITYDLSDETFKMPASILLNSSDTLHKIPEVYFENFRESPYFSDSLRYKYKLNLEYRLASEKETVSYICTTDVISVILPQIIINSVSK